MDISIYIYTLCTYIFMYALCVNTFACIDITRNRVPMGTSCHRTMNSMGLLASSDACPTMG